MFIQGLSQRRETTAWQASRPNGIINKCVGISAVAPATFLAAMQSSFQFRKVDGPGCGHFCALISVSDMIASSPSSPIDMSIFQSHA